MNSKSKKYLTLGLTAIFGTMFIASAAFKLIGGEEAVKGFADMGLSDTSRIGIGLTELLCAILFLIPRTGVLGTVLLIAYMGGTIMAHLATGLPFYTNIIIGIMVGITGWLRFPELGERLFGLKP